MTTPDAAKLREIHACDSMVERREWVRAIMNQVQHSDEACEIGRIRELQYYLEQRLKLLHNHEKGTSTE